MESDVARIIVQLDFRHGGEREKTNPIVLELHDRLHELTEKYEGLSIVVIGYGDRDDDPFG